MYILNTVHKIKLKTWWFSFYEIPLATFPKILIKLSAAIKDICSHVFNMYSTIQQFFCTAFHILFLQNKKLIGVCPRNASVNIVKVLNAYSIDLEWHQPKFSCLKCELNWSIWFVFSTSNVSNGKERGYLIPWRWVCRVALFWRMFCRKLNELVG